MTKQNLFIIFFMLTTFYSKSQTILTIEISNLRNNNGKVLFELRDEKNVFVKGITAEIVKNTCIITVNILKSGKYAFKYFHDENNNEELDKNWLGIPTEGYGFSNNAKGTFGPPDFEEMIFEIKGNKTVKCIPTYF